MASHTRRGINVSAYLQDLNTIPSADEQQIDSFNPDDLDIWTSVQFFDYDMGAQVARDPVDANEQKPVISPTPTTTTSSTSAATSPAIDPSLDEPAGGFDGFLNGVHRN
jgi:hypothetical protein